MIIFPVVKPLFSDSNLRKTNPGAALPLRGALWIQATIIEAEVLIKPKSLTLHEEMMNAVSLHGVSMVSMYRELSAEI